MSQGRENFMNILKVKLFVFVGSLVLLTSSVSVAQGPQPR